MDPSYHLFIRLFLLPNSNFFRKLQQTSDQKSVASLQSTLQMAFCDDPAQCFLHGLHAYGPGILLEKLLGPLKLLEIIEFEEALLEFYEIVLEYRYLRIQQNKFILTSKD